MATMIFLKFMNMVIWAIALATCSYVIANLTSYLIWSLRNKKEFQTTKRLLEREKELEERERELEARKLELDAREEHVRQTIQLIARNNIDFDPFK